jgi:glycosyltransferase involved in cell wall biosynthesis
MLKFSKAMLDNGIATDIVYIGINNGKHPKEEKLDEHRSVWRMTIKTLPVPFTRSWQYFTIFNLKILLRYWRKPISSVQSNSIEDLQAGVLLKKLKPSIKLYYDAHELETEKNSLLGWRKKYYKWKEKTLIKYPDLMFVVSESIGNWYKSKYKNLPPLVVANNIPDRKNVTITDADKKIFREKFSIPNNEIIFLYQGAFMKGRAIKLLLDVFSKLPDKHLVFMGYGALENDIREYGNKYRSIHLHPAVSPKELLGYTAGADVGICIIEPICLSYELTIANKFFEYMLVDLPVLVSDFLEMANVIKKYNNGWITDPTSVEAILKTIASINKEELEQKRKNAGLPKADFRWENEEKKIIAGYKSTVK